MGSLAGCLPRKFKFPDTDEPLRGIVLPDQKILKKSAKEYIARGMEQGEAETKAIDDMIAMRKSELKKFTQAVIDAYTADNPVLTNPKKSDLEAKAKTQETDTKKAEEKRDKSLAAYHHYETASAAVQIAIVLASAEVITSVIALGWASAALGVVAVVFCVIGYFWPMSVHLF